MTAVDERPSAGPPEPPSPNAQQLEKLLSAKNLPKQAPQAVAGLALLASFGIAIARDSYNLAPIALLTFFIWVVVLVTWSAVVEGRRRATDRFATSLVIGAFLTALSPLLAVLIVVVQRGLVRLDANFFANTMRSVGPRDDYGGYRHAIIGTLEQVAMASAIAIPLGILVAIYLVEFGGGRRFAQITSYVVDVMTGLPSVVAGLFILAFLIIALGFGFSGFAAALALGILMLPVVIRSSEEMLRLVPDDLREASYALGVPRWKTVMSIVIPTALPGMITGIMLAVARVFGETAPVLLVAFGTPNLQFSPFAGPQASLPLQIFQDAAQPQQLAVDRAWTGALVLIALVLLLNLGARLGARFFGPRALKR